MARNAQFLYFSKMSSRPSEILSTVVARIVPCDWFNVFDIDSSNFVILHIHVNAALIEDDFKKWFFQTMLLYIHALSKLTMATLHFYFQ